MFPATILYGVTNDSQDAHLYILSNSHGMAAAVTDLGACLVSARVPDAHGNLLDVVLGHAGVRGYEHNPMGFGATVGRHANRIAGAQFSLDGTTVTLEANEGANSLHSGPDLWHQRLWQLVELGENSVTLGLGSPDGDQGFPGQVSARATYQLTEDDRLVVTYEADCAQRTVVNMTNHTYWNLDGHASGTILQHTLTVDADNYLPVDEGNIPLGPVAPVEGTVFDLWGGTVLQDVLSELPLGFDHNLCLRLTDKGALTHAARLSSGRSGIVMDVLTDAPGLQVYMAGWLDDMTGKDGAAYGRFSGVALETQHWPDSVHHADWPSAVCGPDKPFAQTTVFAFSVA